MSSSIVIKVKYGDTLRRFNALVGGEKLWDLDMEGLRVKIFSLFSFPEDANFNLTYIDEDDDLVTIANDEDLHDVVRQGLNPVRITVHLTADKSTRSCTRSTRNSTHSSRSSSQSLPHCISPGVAEVWKSVPEPLRLHVLSKLSVESASKATSTSPMLADLIDNLSKMGHCYLNTSCSHDGMAGLSGHEEVFDNPEDTSSIAKLGASSNKRVKANGTQTSSSVHPARKNSEVTEAVNATKGAELIRSSLFPPCSFKKGKNVNSEPAYNQLPTCHREEKDKEFVGDAAGKSRLNGHNMDLPQLPTGDGKEDKKLTRDAIEKSGVTKHTSKLPEHVPSGQGTSAAPAGETRGVLFGRNSCESTFDSSTVGVCPFSGIPLEPLVHKHSVQSFERTTNHSDGMVIAHKHVRCDGCGVFPITGPRFKSKVKHNYDLCSVCFARVGNHENYTRINFPLPYRHRLSFIGSCDPVPFKQVPSVMTPHAAKRLRPRLDSHFVIDVNVFDGTMMAPSTPFTKIWRLHNNGTLPWPPGVQLLWIGGDRFSASDSVELEIPTDGVNVGNEHDIAVDFIAPELPGRYVSYWRMAEPSGHKFGQRVWVLIQVDSSLNDNICESSRSLNLNLPPGRSPIVLDVNTWPTFDVEAGDMEEKAPPEEKRDMGDLNIGISNDLLVDGEVPSPVSATSSSSVPPRVGADKRELPVTSSVKYPDDVTANAHSAIHPSASCPIIDMPKESHNASSNTKDDKRNPEKTEIEANLLKELEEMGFKQVDLNKEGLQRNEYDLERSVDDLCGVYGWDPILKELQEMGFQDRETNKKLLGKNNGSIVRVVIDLISGEKSLEES